MQHALAASAGWRGWYQSVVHSHTLPIMSCRPYPLAGNPSTGEVEKEFPTATDAEVQDALARSHAAYGEWRTTTLEERATILRSDASVRDRRKAPPSPTRRHQRRATQSRPGVVHHAPDRLARVATG